MLVCVAGLQVSQPSRLGTPGRARSESASAQKQRRRKLFDDDRDDDGDAAGAGAGGSGYRSYLEGWPGEPGVAELQL